MHDEGNRRALDQLYSATYEELRRLASSVRRGSPGISLSPTTLVNEAWSKLAASPGFVSTSRLHFKRIAARAMRQVLVEAARRKSADKRGGREAVFVTLDEAVAAAESTPGEFLALDAAYRVSGAWSFGAGDGLEDVLTSRTDPHGEWRHPVSVLQRDVLLMAADCFPAEQA
jgi:hypothetical protein